MRGYTAGMDEALNEIVEAIKGETSSLDDVWLNRLLRRHSRGSHGRTLSKTRLLARYQELRQSQAQIWRAWELDGSSEARLLALLQTKPRRSASGVATISVLTKPWPCSSDCLYCPCDIRMPKSYLANEPACQRAERNFFDPYLQVKARLRVLSEMGHPTDKIELIVLGGSWNDYPEGYQRWFVRELFRALNDEFAYEGGPEERDAGVTEEEGPEKGASKRAPLKERLVAGAHGIGSTPAERCAFYLACGLASDAASIRESVAADQQRVNAQEQSYNQAIQRRLSTPGWQAIAAQQQASWEELEAEQRANECAAHRMVGLVIETRPDLISPQSARTLRRLGATKVQMGIQSLSDEVLAANERRTTAAQIAHAFAILRIFGFKSHVHAMVNLLGSTPEDDKADYLQLVGDPAFMPDEVKLYPCALVASSRLMEAHQRGLWRPYSEEELVDVLVGDVLATPAWTRISRMIRDIPSTDILAGNRRTNLRQLVESRLAQQYRQVREIRMREIATSNIDPSELRLVCERYATSTSQERFLQWVTEDGHIAAFCRLSLPDAHATRHALGDSEPPLPPDTAIIRELHVYGRVAELGAAQQGVGRTGQGAAQHIGLGRALVGEARRLAQEAGYEQIAVISAVGTRAYYRSLGFADADLYQLSKLSDSQPA